MAAVAVRVEDFTGAALPERCAAGGGPPVRYRRCRATFEPGWPLVFLVLGPIGVVVSLAVTAACTRHVEGWLPVSDEAQARAVRHRRATPWAVLAVAVPTTAAVIALAVTGRVGVAVAVGVVGTVGAGVALWLGLSPPGRLRAQLAADGRTVTLRGVEAGFVVACEQAELARQRGFDV